MGSIAYTSFRSTVRHRVRSTTARIVTGPPDPHSPGIETYVDELLELRRELGLDAEVVFVH